MSIYTPPPVEPVSARLVLGEREVDLATRCLVASVVPSPTWARESEVIAAVRAAADAGADLAEVPADPRLLGPAAQRGGLPLAARVTTPRGARSARAAGAAVLMVPLEHVSHVTGLASAGSDAGGTRPTADVGPVMVLVRSAREIPEARGSGGEGTVAAIDTLHLPAVDLVAEASLGLALGARILRTDDVHRARRVVEIMAALLEARR